jgi:hypothetical protein
VHPAANLRSEKRIRNFSDYFFVWPMPENCLSGLHGTYLWCSRRVAVVFVSSKMFLMKQSFINTTAYRTADETTMKETGYLMGKQLGGMNEQ